MKVIPNPNPPEPRESKPSPYCGRVDDHPPHEHISHEPVPSMRVILTCPGAPIVEGGHPIHQEGKA